MTKKRRKAAPAPPEDNLVTEQIGGGRVPDPRAVAEDPVVPDENIDVFGLDLSAPEPEPSEDDVVAPIQEPTEPKSRVTEDELVEADPEPEPVAAEPVIEDEETPAEPSAEEKHEKGLRDALTRQRKQNQELQAQIRAHEAAKQAPPPLPPQYQPPPESLPPPELRPEDLMQTQWAGETSGISKQELQQMVRQYAQEAVQPDPETVAKYYMEQGRQQWVQRNPTQAQVAEEVKNASTFVSLSFDALLAKTGQTPQGFHEIVRWMDESGVSEQLREGYPIIEDQAEFMHSVMTGGEPQAHADRINRYMDGIVTRRSWRAAAGADPGMSAALEAQPAGVAPSNVVPLPSKPRSMASKGQGTQKATTDQKEHDKLIAEYNENPFGEDADEVRAKADVLARKLGFARV